MNPVAHDHRLPTAPPPVYLDPNTGESVTCRGGQVWNPCGSACTATCDEPEPICTLQCVPRCVCPPPLLLRDDSGICVLQEECGALAPNLCKEGMVWNNCGSACTPTCDDPTPPCIAMCVKKCECPQSAPLWSSEKGTCVHVTDCKDSFEDDNGEGTRDGWFDRLLRFLGWRATSDYCCLVGPQGRPCENGGVCQEASQSRDGKCSCKCRPG